MSRFLARWIVSAAALAIVAWALRGIVVGEGFQGFVTVFVGAAILSAVNTLVRPLLVLLSCPLILATLGLFLFVINAAMLLLASWISSGLGLPFYVAGWGNAIVGSILLTIVNWLLSGFVPGKDKKRKKNKE